MQVKLVAAMQVNSKGHIISLIMKLFSGVRRSNDDHQNLENDPIVIFTNVSLIDINFHRLIIRSV